MSYLVLAYPTLSEEDYSFIQEYRKINDQKYFSLVDPHFTIVFSTNKFSETDFIDEVEKQAQGITPIEFVIRCATINQDDSGDFYHEFLVPDEGYSNIVKLHDKLYFDTFYETLRFDIDFIPHIGIGNNNDVHISKKRVDKLNLNNLSITGSIRTLDVVKYEDNKVSTIKKIKLLI